MRKETDAYERLKDEYVKATDRASYAFGVPSWSRRVPIRIHHDGEKFLVTVRGLPCIEVGREHYVLFAPPQGAHYDTYAWNQVVADITRTGNKLKVDRRVDKRLGLTVTKLSTTVGNVPFIGYCVLNRYYIVTNTDFDSLVVSIDTDRVNTFKRKLRQLLKPYEVLIRLDSRHEELKILKKETWKVAGPLLSMWGIQNSDNLLPEFIRRVEDDVPLSFEEISRFMFDEMRNGRFGDYDSASFLSSVKNIRNKIRLTFTHLASTVEYEKYIPEDAYVKYQGLVLQSANGLRTVPLQGKVEVYRPRSRTRATLAPGEIRTC